MWGFKKSGNFADVICRWSLVSAAQAPQLELESRDQLLLGADQQEVVRVENAVGENMF